MRGRVGDGLAGVEWCASLADEIAVHLGEIPILELIPENFFSSLGNFVPPPLDAALRQHQVPVMVHAVGLSLAAQEPLRPEYLDEIRRVMDALPVVASLSDHLCLTELAGNDIGQLTSVFYDEPTLDAVCDKVTRLQRQFDLPFAVENITHNFTLPGQPMSEPEFIRRLIARTGCALLLDLNNIYTNGVNFGLDPSVWLDEIDLEWVEAIHLAGGFYDDDGLLQDGHCAPVPAPVWALYERVIADAGRPIPTIVERTGNNEAEGLAPVLADQRRAQAILDRAAAARPSRRAEAGR